MWFKKAKKKFLSWGADIRVYKSPMFFVFFGDSHYKIKGTDMRTILNTLVAGDILLRKYDHYIGSRVIPGYWSHAAVYIGDDKVVHMLGEGIVIEDILTFMRCDDIAILRHEDPEIAVRATNITIDLSDDNIPYDYDFKAKNKALYCSELTAKVYGYGLDNIPGLKGKKMILPDDMLKIPKLSCIWARDDHWIDKEEIIDGDKKQDIKDSANQEEESANGH